MTKIHFQPLVTGDFQFVGIDAHEMVDRLIADRTIGSVDRLSVLVNSLGATPPEELYILYRVVKKRIEDLGATIVMPLVGRYATSMEMSGVSMTFCFLNQEREALLQAPARCAFWQVG